MNASKKIIMGNLVEMIVYFIRIKLKTLKK